MKNFVNKHTTLLFVLAIMPLNSVLYVTSKYIFDYWNLTMFLIQIGLFLLQMIPFVLVTTLSTKWKINYLKPFKKLFFWIKLFIYSKIYSKYYYLAGEYGECWQECPIKMKSKYGFIRMVGSTGCKEDCKNCITSGSFNNTYYIKCKHVSKNKLNIFSWIKKLFTLLLICTLLSSCNVYLNCNINKTQQLSKRQIDKHHKQAEKQTELQESIWY